MIAVLVFFALLAAFGYALEGIWLRSEYDTRRRRNRRLQKYANRVDARQRRRRNRQTRPVVAPAARQALGGARKAYRWADGISRR